MFSSVLQLPKLTSHAAAEVSMDGRCPLSILFQQLSTGVSQYNFSGTGGFTPLPFMCVVRLQGDAHVVSNLKVEQRSMVFFSIISSNSWMNCIPSCIVCLAILYSAVATLVANLITASLL
jgi:hypothetical protein